MFSRKEYTYTLPPELIAQEKADPAHNARVMVVDRSSWSLEEEWVFLDLPRFLSKDSVLFFNNSRVLPARIQLDHTPYEHTSGERKVLQNGEIFYLSTIDASHIECLVRPGTKFKKGTRFFIWTYTCTVEDMTSTGRIIEVLGGDIVGFLNTHGSLPLPPYIEYKKQKETAYQTAFAEKDGSVAAPTASLHFTHELLENITHAKKYLTLHVWLGTFKWIDTEDIREYAIHKEVAEIDLWLLREIAHLKKSWKKILAVGTTACRTLESLPALYRALDEAIREKLDTHTRQYWENLIQSQGNREWISDISLDASGSVVRFTTAIYITPGHEFLIVDELITNFHLPESSLIVLVSAFIWREQTMSLYQKAIEKVYRFYSFWDGMYIRLNS